MNKQKNTVETQFDNLFAQKEDLDYIFDVTKLKGKDLAIAKALLAYGVVGNSCLDIGPGSGRWIRFLQYHDANELSAVDISDQALERCIRICTKTQKADLETDTLSFSDDAFDIVISIEVLEHLHNPENYISEILRVAKSGAFVLISLPNISSFISRIRLFMGLLPVAIASDPTHVGFYRQKDLRRLFTKYDQTIEFLPTSISMNPFNPKSRFRFPSIRFLSSFDDSVVFYFKVRK